MKTWKQLSVMAIVVIIAFAFVFTACDDGNGNNNNNGTSPEQLSTTERWGSWADPTTSVAITHSVANDGVCTITVGGTELTTQPLFDHIWKACASYKYTAQAGKYYEYKFEAWTDAGTRKVQLQWYADNNTSTYHGTKWIEAPTGTFTPGFEITNTRTTYTVTSTEAIPKSGVQDFSFQCANQTGEFYVKILSITAINYSGTYVADTIKIVINASNCSVYNDNILQWSGNIAIEEGGDIKRGNVNVGRWVYSIIQDQRAGVLGHLLDTSISPNEVFFCAVGTQGVQQGLSFVNTTYGLTVDPTPQATYPDFSFWMYGTKQ